MTQFQHFTRMVNRSQSGKRLDHTLVEIFPNYSRSRIKAWILSGQVKVNGQITIIPKKKITGSELIEVKAIIKEKPQWEAQAIPLNIIYEDDDILIINKPSNLVVHPGAGNADRTMLNALLHYFPPIINVPRAGIVHRLDKDTTGLMVVAKTIPAQIRLAKLLKAREITREYEGVVTGAITSGGTVKQPIARHATKRTHMVVHSMGKPAVTHYRVMESFRAHTHLCLRLETGRTHQIRVHMAYINHPIVGDPLYGGLYRPQKGASETFNNILRSFDRQVLHATLLRFCHPITFTEMEWRAPLPQNMVTLITTLKEDRKMFKEHMNYI